MIVASLVKLTDLNPAILRHIIGFTLFGSIIWVLRADGINVVLGLILELAMQVSQLVARASIFHVCALNYLVGLFINDICLV